MRVAATSYTASRQLDGALRTLPSSRFWPEVSRPETASRNSPDSATSAYSSGAPPTSSRIPAVRPSTWSRDSGVRMPRASSTVSTSVALMPPLAGCGASPPGPPYDWLYHASLRCASTFSVLSSWSTRQSRCGSMTSTWLSGAPSLRRNAPRRLRRVSTPGWRSERSVSAYFLTRPSDVVEEKVSLSCLRSTSGVLSLAHRRSTSRSSDALDTSTSCLSRPTSRFIASKCDIEPDVASARPRSRSASPTSSADWYFAISSCSSTPALIGCGSSSSFCGVSYSLRGVMGRM
mmetsp:Transcript_9682/g.33757  ORF Transcript_9682/g.33757 Transcript_9682/m.33757 type:complete len:290 (-) Transcript_9682:723-1592(-)